MEIAFPAVYQEILDNNVCIVTGAGKSGTTVAALLLASMNPTYHIYEPTLLKIIPPNSTDMINFIVRSTILFDYIYPIVRGMRICDYNFQAINSEWQWATQQSERSRRTGNVDFEGQMAFLYLFRENPLFVINMLNGLSRLDQWKKIFPGMHVIHVVRNGFDVIASETKRRKWHIPESYLFPIQCVADWLTADTEVPLYVEEESVEYFHEWKPQTRAAHLWRTQVNMHPPSIKYEDLVNNPEGVATDYRWKFKKLKETDLTDQWIHRLKLRTIPPHEMTLNDIEEPERDKFKKTMEELGYL